MSLAEAVAYANFLRMVASLANTIAEIQGWLEVDQGLTLMALAQHGPGDGVVVEVGSFMGRSTAYLGSGCKLRGGGAVYAVDHFKGSAEHQRGAPCEVREIAERGTVLPEFTANMKRMGLSDTVRPVVSDSVSAASGWTLPVRLLFLDGGHEYHQVKADFEAWERHLAPDALVAIHDVGDFPGVSAFYAELIAAGGWTEVMAFGSLRVIRR